MVGAHGERCGDRAIGAALGMVGLTSDPTYTHSLRFYTKADGAHHPLSTFFTSPTADIQPTTHAERRRREAWV